MINIITYYLFNIKYKRIKKCFYCFFFSSCSTLSIEKEELNDWF
jgi:hypothetical protein